MLTWWYGIGLPDLQRPRVYLDPSLESPDILQALKKFPFEPLKTASSKTSWKTDFLLAITSTWRASELHVLLVCYTDPYIVISDPEVLMAKR